MSMDKIGEYLLFGCTARFWFCVALRTPVAGYAACVCPVGFGWFAVFAVLNKIQTEFHFEQFSKRTSNLLFVEKLSQN